MIALRIAGDDATQRRLRRAGEGVESGIARTIAKLGLELKNTVQNDKLSGQVLHARTGLLRDGIAVRMDQSKSLIRATIYSNAAYAAAQEFGFTGTENVRASLRRITAAFGRSIAATTIEVGAHSRRMDLPQRSFLRSSLDEMAPRINTSIADAVREALQ